MKVSLSDS